MADQFRPMSDFARAFAAVYDGFMKENRVKGFEVAERLGRNAGYVSERRNGLRPIDTDDVDALASLVDGWTGKTLMIELARRARETSVLAPVTPIGVRGSSEDLPAVARQRDDEPTDEQ